MTNRAARRTVRTNTVTLTKADLTISVQMIEGATYATIVDSTGCEPVSLEFAQGTIRDLVATGWAATSKTGSFSCA